MKLGKIIILGMLVFSLLFPPPSSTSPYLTSSVKLKITLALELVVTNVKIWFTTYYSPVRLDQGRLTDTWMNTWTFISTGEYYGQVFISIFYIWSILDIAESSSLIKLGSLYLPQVSSEEIYNFGTLYISWEF